jgi:predicted negative regulator of RcsB-dependent stress response
MRRRTAELLRDTSRELKLEGRFSGVFADFRLAFWKIGRIICASMKSDGMDVSTRGIEWLAWVEIHKKRLLLGAVAVMLLAGALAIQRWHRIESERAASAALVQVQLTDRAGPAAKEPTASDYQRVASDHEGTRAALRARLLAAEALFVEGHYAEAKTEFERVAARLEDDGLAATAAFGIAAALEAMGKTEEAVGAYQDVTLRHGTTGVATQARLALGGLQEQRGDAALALRSYSELTNAMNSPWREEALVRIDALLARHPELAPADPIASPPIEATPGTNNPAAGT